MAALTPIALASCTSREVEVVYRDHDGYAFTAEDRRSIEAVAERTIPEVRGCLPALPPRIRVQVDAGDQVIAETGETGTYGLPATIYWTVDPKREGGVAATAQRELRATLFHELHHLVRAAKVPSKTVLDRAITEGLATVFERDQAGAPAPWGRYGPEVDRWLAELIAAPDPPEREHYLGRHPDGRRWIAHQVGTYAVDRAAQASKKGPCALVWLTTEEILRLAAP